MDVDEIAREIRMIGIRGKLLSQDQKHRLLTLMSQIARRLGFGAALTALWEQQRAIGFVLGCPTDGENLEDESKFLAKRTGSFWLLHSPARKDRKNVDFLKDRAILAENPKFVYERIDGSCYSHFPAKRHGFNDVCFLCSAERANPNEVLVSVELAGCEFIYGANYATLGHSHFTVWTKVPILQTYWPTDVLIWLCEHGDMLASDGFTTFFNGLGAGNSIKHFHYQTLREPFPIFDVESNADIGIAGIIRLKWPLPAYKIILAPRQDRRQPVSALDSLISNWLGIDRRNTLNLAHRRDRDGTTHIVFIPRIDLPDKRRPLGISNDFGGCEVCGRINIENRDEWEHEKEKEPSELENLLRSVAPPGDQIATLEESVRM